MNRHAPAVSLEAVLIDDNSDTAQYDDTALLEQSRLVQAAGERLARCGHDEAELRDAADVLVHLHGIIKEVASDESVSESTELAIRQATARALTTVDGVAPDVASTESWSTPKERVTLSLEAIGETLKKIWEQLKAALQRLLEAFTGFVKSHVKALDIAYSKFKSMQSALRTPLNWPNSEDLPFSAAGKLTRGGKVSVDWVTRVLRDLMAVGEADIAQLQLCERAATAIKTAVASGVKNRDLDTPTRIAATSTEQYTKGCAEIVKGLNGGSATDATTTSGELSGGYFVVGSTLWIGYQLQRPKDIDVDKLILPTNTAVKNAVRDGLEWTRKQLDAQKALLEVIKRMANDTEVERIVAQMQANGPDEETRNLLKALTDTPRTLMNASRPFLGYIDAVLPTYVQALGAVIKHGQQAA